MRLVNVTPGTESWITFRRLHLGSSDASSILECNPYKSKLELYEEKVFQFEQDDNPYMKRGRELESVALESFEEETGLVLFPCVVKHDSIDWIAASLDGMTIGQDAILEIKCNGKKNHELALKGKIPLHYKAQIMHQLFVTDLDLAYYYSFDGERGVIVEVPRDEEFIKILVEKEFEFWQSLQTFTPPKHTPKAKRSKNATGAIP